MNIIIIPQGLNLNIIINWGYYRKKIFPYYKMFKIQINKHFQGLNLKCKDSIVTELLPKSKRKKSKITYKYFWNFLFFKIEYEKIKIMQKNKLRKLFKKAELL